MKEKSLIEQIGDQTFSKLEKDDDFKTPILSNLRSLSEEGSFSKKDRISHILREKGGINENC
jgi:hypothetical protein